LKGIKENLNINPEIKQHFDVNVEGEKIASAEKDRFGLIDIKKLVWSRELTSAEKYNIVILSDW